jgi:integrase
MARKTVNNRLVVLSSLLKSAHENKLIPKPTLRCHLKRKGAAKDAPIVAVAPEDVAKLISAATDARYRVAVLGEAGLRIGEILGMQWSDIKDGELKARRAADSAGNVGLPKHDKTRDVLSPALELQQMPRRGLWIVSRLDGHMPLGRARRHPRSLCSRWCDDPGQRNGRAAAVAFAAPQVWHRVRRALRADHDLQELMGHEDVATTRRYVTVTKEHKRDEIALAFGQQAGNVLPENGARSKSSTSK